MHCANPAQAEWEFCALCIIARCGEFIILLPYARPQGGWTGRLSPWLYPQPTGVNFPDRNKQIATLLEWIILTFQVCGQGLLFLSEGEYILQQLTILLRTAHEKFKIFTFHWELKPSSF